MKKLALMMVGLMIVASSAFANHCPKDMKAIDEALKTTKLTGAQLEEVKHLRASGETKHKAGDHKGSLVDLNKAEDMLGIPHVM
jgi:hypothetical protein